MKASWFCKFCTVTLVAGIVLLAVRSRATPNGARTTTTIASALNPSTIGQSVTFTMTVTPAESDGSAPTGTVTIKDGTTVLGTVGLNPFTRTQFAAKNLS